MPSRRSSTESGTAAGMESPGQPPKSSTPTPDKRRSIPLPNLETASRLKTYVGNAINTASSAPAWLASKAVPVAADGAGMLRNAAADRVALFRRGTQYDELEEEEDEAMKRRTMALSSADAPPQPSPAAVAAADNASCQKEGSGTAASAADEPGPLASAMSNGALRPPARSSSHDREPAMILFDEDVDPPLPGPAGRGAPAGNEAAMRPNSAASTVSAASDLLSDGWMPAGGSSALRGPPANPPGAAPMRSPAARPQGRAEVVRGSPVLSLAAAAAAAAAAATQPSPDAGLLRRSPYAPLRPSPDSTATLKTPQHSFVSDDSAMEVPLSLRGLGAGASPLNHHQVDETEQGLSDGPTASLSSLGSRNASLQPLIGKETPLRPSRPPPPPPIQPQVALATNSEFGLGQTSSRSIAAPMVSRQSSATSSVPERGSLRRTEDAEPASGGGGGDSWDIFEPRAADVAAAEALQQPPIGAKTDLAALKHMTGRQLLASLEAGAALRKKWVTRLSPAEAAAASKTTRHVRCYIKDGKVFLRYLHQGVKGLLDRGEVSAAVQRVEVAGGNWVRGASITVYTSRGILSLEPLGPAAYSQWVLGLNAALVACQTRRKDYVYACPAHTIPRNSMFIVAEAPAPVEPAAPR